MEECFASTGFGYFVGFSQNDEKEYIEKWKYKYEGENIVLNDKKYIYAIYFSWFWKGIFGKLRASNEVKKITNQYPSMSGESTKQQVWARL